MVVEPSTEVIVAKQAVRLLLIPSQFRLPEIGLELIK
jgi:hypothetical protein